MQMPDLTLLLSSDLLPVGGLAELSWKAEKVGEPEGVVFRQPRGGTEQGSTGQRVVENVLRDTESHLHLPSLSYLDTVQSRAAAAASFWWEVGEKLDIRYCGRSAWAYLGQNPMLQGNP